MAIHANWCQLWPSLDDANAMACDVGRLQTTREVTYAQRPYNANLYYVLYLRRTDHNKLICCVVFSCMVTINTPLSRFKTLAIQVQHGTPGYGGYKLILDVSCGTNNRTTVPDSPDGEILHRLDTQKITFPSYFRLLRLVHKVQSNLENELQEEARLTD